MEKITDDDIKKLLQHFAVTNYTACASDNGGSQVLQKCKQLMERDHKVMTISNTAGELSAAYPRYLIIPDVECGTDPNSFKYETLKDQIQLKELILKAQTARCRSRFPVPVISYNGRYICRSATLSGTPEVYGRSSLNYVLYGSGTTEEEEEGASSSSFIPDFGLVERRRLHDIMLLKALNVETIVDLMVENKKVKYGVRVSSSEKIDKEDRYAKFNIISLPYPGCEFFKDFKENNYSGMNLFFNWEQRFCDAVLNVPDNKLVKSLNIDWENYKQWDLLQITKHYMRLIMRYIKAHSTSLLVHCISGWDRTPLFVSMIRLSLWADGVVHKNLNAHEILYLTIGYDWFLFGHQLPSRLYKGEDIFYFCFYMLKHITRNKYSCVGRRSCKHPKTAPASKKSTSDEAMNVDDSSPSESPKVDYDFDDLETFEDIKSEAGAPPLFDWLVVDPMHSTSPSSGCNTTLEEEKGQESEATAATEEKNDAPQSESAQTVDDNISKKTAPQKKRNGNSPLPSQATIPTIVVTDTSEPAPGPSKSAANIAKKQKLEGKTGENMEKKNKNGSPKKTPRQEDGARAMKSPVGSPARGAPVEQATASARELEEEVSESAFESDASGNPIPQLKCRKCRLMEVRALFITCYSDTIPAILKKDQSIAAKIGHFAERVGLTSSK